MKGVYIMGDRSVEVRELPKPEPQHGQVLVRATVVGICGSDLHLYRRESQPETKRFVQGHELTGVVEAVGPGVETVKEGDRVVAYQAWGCGHCALCASGHANLCSNRKIIGKSNRYQKDYSVITEAMCLPLPDEMSFDDGVLLSCAGGTSWAALDKVKPCCDDTVVVFGLGPVGLMGGMWARSMGAFVIGVETIERRLDLGKRMGAHIVVDSLKENPVQKIMELTGSGATIGFESSGNKKAQSDVLAATHWSARVVYVAIGAEGAVIDPRVGRGGQLGVRTVYGTYTYSLADWYRMSRAVVLHGLKPGAIVTHRFPLEKASEAYAIADRGDCGKVVFSWDNVESS